MRLSSQAPRVLRAVDRPINFSSPAPGRPEVWWVEGIDPNIVREYWCSAGELPYEESMLTLPPRAAELFPGNPKVVKARIFGEVRKLVVYERAFPNLRLVFLLGEPFMRDGHKWQPVLKSCVERDRGVDPKESQPLEKRLWAEICQVERRGRPRGTGHPKRAVVLNFPVSAKNIDSLRRAGLDDKDLRILFERSRNKSFKHIGQELKMSAQATWKRWRRHVVPAIKKLNPTFSEGSLKLHSLDPLDPK